ncbi:hypothetical protein LINPERPRIM_LOCUS4402 [Linum perenne]
MLRLSRNQAAARRVHRRARRISLCEVDRGASDVPSC